jgi:hypothetical protein
MMSKIDPIEPTDADADRDSVMQSVLDAIRGLGDRAGPEDVLQAAQDPLSPLHGYFTWDDSAAAERYRRLQAGVLLRRVRYHIARVDQNTREVTVTTVRATVSVPEERSKSGSRSYGETVKVMSDEAKRANVLRGIVRELVSLRNKYRVYSELHDVWVVIDDVADQFDAPSTGRRKRPTKSAPPPAA